MTDPLGLRDGGTGWSPANYEPNLTAVFQFLDDLDLALNGHISRDPNWKVAVIPISPGRCSRAILEALRKQAVRRAWRMEAELITRTGRGTRAWTQAEIGELLQTGKVSGFQGHHINNVANNPIMAADPDNVRFVRGTAEHLA